MYDATLHQQLFQDSFSFAKVLVNPGRPLLYFTTSDAGNHSTFLYDVSVNRIVKKINGTIQKVSEDGKLIYGDVDFKNYLFNESLIPVSEVNRCTHYINRIIGTGGANYLVAGDNSQCDFKNQTQNATTAFTVWDLNRLKKMENEREGIYSLEIPDQYCFFNDNFYCSSYGSIYSFKDTAKTESLNKKYGDLVAMRGSYLAFANTNYGSPPESDDWGTIVTLTKNISDSIAHIYLKNSLEATVWIDTLQKKVIVVSDRSDNTMIRVVSVWNMNGIKLKEFLIPANSKDDIYSPSTELADVSEDMLYMYLKNPTVYYNEKIRHTVINLKTGKSVLNLILPKSQILQLNINTGTYWYSDTSNFVYTGSFYRSGSGPQLKRIYALYGDQQVLLAVKPAGQYKNYQPSSLLFPQNGIYTLFLIDLEKGDTLYRQNMLNEFVTKGTVSPNHEWIAFANNNNQIEIVNIPSKKRDLLKAHSGYIADIYFTNDGRKLISCARDGLLKIWSLDSLREMITIVNFTNQDYLISTPKGFYYSTKGAQSKFGFSIGDAVLTSQQSDLILNRPDIVLRNTGCTDSSLINAYESAWKKRVQRSAFGKANFNSISQPPNVFITNLDTIGLVADRKQLTLSITAVDSSNILKQLSVRINDCPLWGTCGLNLVNRNNKNFDTSVNVSLSDSINKIEVYATNSNGTESYHMPLYINYLSQQPDSGKLHFIGIGINRFANSQNNLSWSVKDIRDLANSFKTRYGSTCTIDTLFDEAVTTTNVTALKQKLLQTGVNDKVIVAYSGHGLLSRDYDYYLSTYNINFSKPEEGGLPYEVLENLLDSIPARKKLMLIDACHSGEVDKEEMLQYQIVQQHLDSTKIKKGVYLLINKDAKRLGTKNSFELMQELFVNVGRSTGATIISAAAGTQFALERNNLQNGVFTYSILEYMKANPHVTVSELKKYVNQRVPELTQGVQVPTARSETNSVDWKVW